MKNKIQNEDLRTRVLESDKNEKVVRLSNNFKKKVIQEINKIVLNILKD